MANAQIWRHVRNPSGRRPLPGFRTTFGLLVAVLLIAIFLMAVASIKIGAAGTL